MSAERDGQTVFLRVSWDRYTYVYASDITMTVEQRYRDVRYIRRRHTTVM